jgi:hypothetical protein
MCEARRGAKASGGAREARQGGGVRHDRRALDDACEHPLTACECEAVTRRDKVGFLLAVIV